MNLLHNIWDGQCGLLTLLLGELVTLWSWIVQYMMRGQSIRSLSFRLHRSCILALIIASKNRTLMWVVLSIASSEYEYGSAGRPVVVYDFRLSRMKKRNNAQSCNSNNNCRVFSFSVTWRLAAIHLIRCNWRLLYIVLLIVNSIVQYCLC